MSSKFSKYWKVHLKVLMIKDISCGYAKCTGPSEHRSSNGSFVTFLLQRREHQVGHLLLPLCTLVSRIRPFQKNSKKSA